MKKKVLLSIAAAILIVIFGFYIVPSYMITPASIDDLITVNPPEDWEPHDLIESEEGIDVEKTFISDEGNGFLSVSTFSYKGRDVWAKPYKKNDWEKVVDSLKGLKVVEIGENTWYIGTSSSDDMPDMLLRAFVEKGDYVFEFRLSNFDEQVTKHQRKVFLEILKNCYIR